MSLYVHPENQKMLWSAISKSLLFQNLGTSQDDWFRSVVQQMHDRTPSVVDTEQLSKMNKDTILVMLDVLKNTHVPNTQTYSQHATPNTYSQHETPNTYSQHATPSRNDYAAQKQNEIDAHYKHLQSQYQTMLMKETPAQISFKEPALDEPITNMDELIEKHRAEREMLKYAPSPLKIDSQTIPPPIENIVVFDSKDTPNTIKKSVHWENTSLEEMFAKWKVELLTDIRSEIASTMASFMQNIAVNRENPDNTPDLLDS